jgi:hypothetical protein
VDRPTTEEWARSHQISTAPTPPAVEGYNERCRFTARQVAARAVILHGVVAVASDCDPGPIMHWFQRQKVWSQVTPRERQFLRYPLEFDEAAWNAFRWQQEAEWALLWVVGKVEALGLPTQECDTRRMVDEIIPPLGSDAQRFLASARLRPPGVLLAEDDRHYDLWCRYHQTRKLGPDAVPADLDVGVLYQREHAFEWLRGPEPWDDVQCDA